MSGAAGPGLTFNDRLHVTLGGIDVVQSNQQVTGGEWGHSGASLTCKKKIEEG